MGHETLAKLRMRPLHEERIGKKLRAHARENRISKAAPPRSSIACSGMPVTSDTTGTRDRFGLGRRQRVFAGETHPIRERHSGYAQSRRRYFEDRSKQMRFRGL